MKTTKTLPLSENATGIRTAETKTVTKNGINEKCINISFEVKPLSNQIVVKYEKAYFDNNDNRLEVASIKKKIIVRDEGEIGEVELDSDLNEIEGTYVKIKDEALNVTDWDTQLGGAIIPSLIQFVELTEGYISE